MQCVWCVGWAGLGGIVKWLVKISEPIRPNMGIVNVAEAGQPPNLENPLEHWAYAHWAQRFRVIKTEPNTFVVVKFVSVLKHIATYTRMPVSLCLFQDNGRQI